jgi:ABC-type branched-subunit amino acid transport system ATPase component
MQAELHQAMVIAEANQQVIVELASRVVVMAIGRQVFAAPTEEFTRNSEVQRRYLSIAAD